MTHLLKHSLWSATTAIILLAAVIADAHAQIPNFTCYQTCKKQYVDGVYQCAQFAGDFNAECATNGLQSWSLRVACSGGSKAAGGHAVNIVLVPDPNSVNVRFCVVDPQDGSTIGCYYAPPGTTSPTAVPQNFLNKVCQNVGYTTGSTPKIITEVVDVNKTIGSPINVIFPSAPNTAAP